MVKIVCSSILMLLFFTWTCPISAAMYKWTDENGVLHFSDTSPSNELKGVETHKTYNASDTSGVNDFSPTSVALKCFNSIINNDFKLFKNTLHPQKVKNQFKSEKKLYNFFNKYAELIRGAEIKTDKVKTSGLNRYGSSQYHVAVVIDTDRGQISEVVVLEETNQGWKIVDL